MKNFEQNNMPIVEAVYKYARRRRRRFHTPGHKGRPPLPGQMLAGVYRYDVTELPGLDNLHRAEGSILSARRLLAGIYGARESYFLVNGSTSGVLAMMLATLNPGDKLLVGRDAHFSVMSGLVLTGAVPVYIPAYVDSRTRTPLGVKTDDVISAMEAHPDAKAVLLVRPGYHGTCCDLGPVVKKARACGMLVLVDEAHGAHLAFAKDAPAPAISLGADMCCQSPHKTLGGLTQSAWLHVNGDNIDIERLMFALRIVQSSSPSYLLMASLDIARRDMALQGKRLVGRAFRLARQARAAVNDTAGPLIMNFASCGPWELDVTKITVDAGLLGISGNRLSRILRRVYRIEPEYSDDYKALFLITPYDTQRSTSALVRALTELARRPMRRKVAAPGATPPYAACIPPMAIPPREAFFAPAETVPCAESAGRVCAETVVPCPPGIPVVYPGEVITPEVLQALGNCENVRVLKGRGDRF